jgi:hypothetical protein
MKKLFLALLCVSSLAFATETIVVLNPQGAGYSGTPQFLATIDEANKIQNKYQFVPEFKVGGFESVALLDVKNHPQTRITSVVTSHLEAADRGLIKLDDYVPVFANGDACWALASNKPLKDLKEIIVGAPALGGALHLDALEIGKKYNKPVRFIFYKTNGEAVLAMMQGDVNLTLDRVVVFENYKKQFPTVEFVAMTCNVRHPAVPNLRTLKELGIDAPPIFNVIVASKAMDLTRRQDIRQIFERASKNLGQDRLSGLGDHVPALFQNIDSDTYYYARVARHKSMREKWKKEVDSSR